MIKSIAIENLRGIAEGKIDDLAQVNIIVGPNNSGKSTILDALLIGASPNPWHVIQKVVDRRKHLVDPHLWLLSRVNGNRAIQAFLTVATDENQERFTVINLVNQAGQTPVQVTYGLSKEEYEELTKYSNNIRKLNPNAMNMEQILYTT
ncbi:MAG: AAA family ATPase [Phycisphaerales bacterium]|nr:AAA family ATPase [Phycisphaerales bacterium]